MAQKTKQKLYQFVSFINDTKISTNFNSFKEILVLSNSLKYVPMTAEDKLF